MKQLQVTYPSKQLTILFEPGIINANWQFIDKSLRYVVIVDEHVFALYQTLLLQLPNLVDIIQIPAKESSKSLACYQRIVEKLLQLHIHRQDVLIAFGGGVTGDITGFVASTYLRGISYIQIPTSLIAQVDAAIGGKTGINVQNTKNQLGTFYHPEQIIIDPHLLNTLPQQEQNNGMAEIIKYALIGDSELFEMLEAGHYALSDVIFRCVQLKLAYTLADERDIGQRQILNFGHTIGHILEKNSALQLSHGQAVAMGMILELTNEEIKGRVTELLNRYQLLKSIDLTSIDWYNNLPTDKKCNGRAISWIQIDEIGKAYLTQKMLNEVKL